MIGIGGGVPSKADIRLGDIVVRTRVIQCDLGKIVGDGQPQRTAVPKISHHLLRAVVSTLRLKHELSPSRDPSILQQKLEGYSAHSRQNFPDHLFHAANDHRSFTPGYNKCDHSN